MKRAAAAITPWSASATSGLAERSDWDKIVIEAPFVVGSRNLFDESSASQSHAARTPFTLGQHGAPHAVALLRRRSPPFRELFWAVGLGIGAISFLVDGGRSG